jgi:hypothetical protein
VGLTDDWVVGFSSFLEALGHWSRAHIIFTASTIRFELPTSTQTESGKQTKLVIMTAWELWGAGVRSEAVGWKHRFMQLVQLIGPGPEGGRGRTGKQSGKSHHASRIHSSLHNQRCGAGQP